MALTSTSFTTTFDLTTTPQKRFRFHDTTNYAAQGITLSWVKNVLTIVAPGDVTIYTNNNYSTPNINPSVSLNDLILIPLQVDAGGNVVQGEYTVIMTSQVNDGVNPIYYFEHSQTFTYEYSSPTVSINQSVNCVSPLFTSTDETVYTVNGVIPSITRNHSVYFPIGSGLSNITGSTAQTITLGSGLFANGTQTTEITTALSYNFLNNLYVTDSVTGVLEIQVNCEWVCKITCCLTALNNRMESQRCSNYPAFLQTKDIFTQVMSKVTLIMQLISCGKENEVSSILTQIQELANCTDDCCGKDTPSLVTGISGGSGSSANVIVNSGGSPVSVNAVTVGDTTTYTVSVDSSFITQVNNSYNTVVANGGGITWTDSGVINGVRTFTPSVSVVPQDTLAFALNLRGYSNTGLFSFIIQNVEISGTTFTTPTANYAVLPYNPSSSNAFKISNFFSGTPNANFKVFAEVITSEIYLSDGLSMIDKAPQFLLPMNIIDKSNGNFTFRFEPTSLVGGTTTALSFKNLAYVGPTFSINFLITK